MRIGVLGAGESGRGAALLAKKLKFEVIVSDAGEIPEPARKELEINNIPFEEKGHTIDRLNKSDLIVKSPGIPPGAAVVRKLRQSGVEIVSEIEFASRHLDGQILAITGSNGKTTTATLCHHLLEAGGIDAALCGNVGVSLARVVAESDHDWYVVEVSSFQLEDVIDFHPKVAVLLNITPDHLDRYGGSFEAYAKAKMRITENLTAGDLLIYNGGDATLERLVGELNVSCTISEVDADMASAFELGPGLAMGKHNVFNAACAITAVRFAGLKDAAIQGGLLSFKRPAHRMELVAEIDGIAYINDSKATNTDAVYYALEAQDTPVIWIAGGQDKGNDYSELLPLVRDKVKGLICLGLNNEKLKLAFSAEVDIIKETTDVNEAVSMAASIARPGDVVLLSPACASFDLFKNYKERGDLFRQAVTARVK